MKESKRKGIWATVFIATKNVEEIIKFTLKTRCKLFNIRPHQFILGKSRSKTLLNQYTTECGEKTTTARVKCHVLVYIYHNTMVRYMIQL